MHLAHVAAGLLREARLEAGLTQAELAARAAVSQPSVSRIESGRGNAPQLTQLDRLLRACGKELRIDAVRSIPQVDLDQIRQNLRLTPAQRLRRHDAARRNLDDVLSRARRVPS